MDFIERLCNVAPDAGSGMTEWSIVLVCVCVSALFAARVVSAKWLRVRLPE